VPTACGEPGSVAVQADDHSMIEGKFARFPSLPLYKMHPLALQGFSKAAPAIPVCPIARRTEPSVKLH
jgi:hypothetical protein